MGLAGCPTRLERGVANLPLFSKDAVELRATTVRYPLRAFS
jgi:hypothetical protein